MWSKILSFFLPEHCVICGQSGTSICPTCLDLPSDNSCLHCGGSLPCRDCILPWQSSVMIGWRDQQIGQLAEALKFAPRPTLARPLALTLARDLYPLIANATVKDPKSAQLPIIVPVPTSRRHKSERGFDHALLVAHNLAQIFSTECLPLLVRSKAAQSTTQLGSDRRRRHDQAQGAFVVNQPLDPTRHYILYDDITTTGATLQAASTALRHAGARHITVAVLAKSR